MEHTTENIFTYTLPPITGFITLYIEKTNMEARFHALQSILFGILFIGTFLILALFLPTVIRETVLAIIKTVFFAVWLYVLYKAYRNEHFELPYIGNVAKKAMTNTQETKDY